MPVNHFPNPKDRSQSPPRVDPFTTSFYGQSQIDLLVRLDSKRRQLDEETAEFKAAKLAEYRNYEQMLREYYECRHELPEETEQERTLHEQAYGRPEQQITASALATPTNSQQTKDTQARKPGPITLPNRPISALQDADSTSRSKTSLAGSSGPPQPQVVAEGRLSHEHEKEFRGVFTPNYLPLLDGKINDKDRRNSSELLEASTLGTSELPNANRGHVTGLSSSAEYHHPPMTSPPAPPTRPLSASVPQEESLGHRRASSSGTDIVNRRSSLRNKKEPRSPKRVLFNIDNTVVSPSTSPIAQRVNSMTPTKASRGSESNDGFQIVRNKQERTSPAYDTTMPRLLSTSFTGTAASGWRSDMSPLRWAYESESKNRNSPFMGGDDFEHVDRDDDIFAFDEEMEVEEKAPAGDKKKAGVDFDREGEKEEAESQDTLIGGSPHAGSLPIEIKWPARSGSFRGSP